MKEISIRSVKDKNEREKIGMKLLTRKYEFSGPNVIVNFDDEQIIMRPEDYKFILYALDSVREAKPDEYNDLRLRLESEVEIVPAFRDYYEHDYSAQVPKIMFKLYFRVKPATELERHEIGRKWIDFNSQINSKGYIWDEYRQYGLYAMDAVMMVRYKDDPEFRKRYGIDYMVLAPMEDTKYLAVKESTGTEIIGDRYKVLHHGHINDGKTKEFIERAL